MLLSFAFVDNLTFERLCLEMAVSKRVLVRAIINFVEQFAFFHELVVTARSGG